MRTNYKLSLCLSACLLVFGTSCNDDFLDKNPLNSVSTQVFWSSEADVQTALAGVYSRLQQNFLGYERVYLDGLSDNAYLDPGNGNQGGMHNMTIGSISPSTGGAMINMYSTPYRAIASCNYFLDNVDKAPMSDAQKNVYKAEVRFIRALAYFDLVQSFGDVIIYKNFPATLEEAKIAKSPKADVYAFIEEDLKFAINNLPDEKYNGHAVKGSAQGMLGRVLVTQKKWNEAVPVLQQIITTGKFGLSNNYAALFTRAGQANAAVNKEIMFSTQYLAPNNVHRTSPGAAGMDIELGLWSLMQPYKDLVDEYEMTDGKMPSESPLYDPGNPYANRDPRLDMTVKLPGEVWKNAAGVPYTDSYDPKTGFLMEKYVELARAPITPASATSSDQDYIHLRYADVLLMYAEAMNEANGPSAAVYDALNQVRNRPGVNMLPVDQAKYNTKEKLRDFIRHERRIELALEGQRYNDLKRWNIAHTKLPTLRTPAGTPLVFEQRNYELPFPASEIDNNPKLTPNPNY
ncbi:RagB/SusD family nutrient uptake outer membrane protein [Botryobacter ruber]|uniref:RagB/SusD family nutrient uptake outer membrane protein n=1 Tax=Botryobacter ruber TaxID=2171629 RepID=UPI000E0CAB36|nr:RagB/SusD family nutrient uptake outer membrane protein [Botryobacter ruber]